MIYKPKMWSVHLIWESSAKTANPLFNFSSEILQHLRNCNGFVVVISLSHERLQYNLNPSNVHQKKVHRSNIRRSSRDVKIKIYIHLNITMNESKTH